MDAHAELLHKHAVLNKKNMLLVMIMMMVMMMVMMLMMMVMMMFMMMVMMMVVMMVMMVMTVMVILIHTCVLLSSECEWVWPLGLPLKNVAKDKDACQRLCLAVEVKSEKDTSKGNDDAWWAGGRLKNSRCECVDVGEFVGHLGFRVWQSVW